MTADRFTTIYLVAALVVVVLIVAGCIAGACSASREDRARRLRFLAKYDRAIGRKAAP